MVQVGDLLAGAYLHNLVWYEFWEGGHGVALFVGVALILKGVFPRSLAPDD